MNLEAYQDRTSWLAARGIGGSAVAAIRGRSPFRGPWDVWVEMQPDVERGPETLVQAEGHRFEPYIVAEYEHATGLVVQALDHAIVRHPEFWWATASPDGLVGEDGGVELKTARDASGWCPDSRAVLDSWTPDADALAPAGYLDQVYWYLECTGRPWWDLAVWIPQSWGFPRLRIVRVLADRPHQRRILLDVARWRHAHIVEGREPEITSDDACRRWLGRNAPTDKIVVDATDEQAVLVADLAFARRRKAEAERAAREVEARLAATMGDAYGVRMGDVRCLWTASKGRPTVDMDMVGALCPDAIKPGRPFRSFRLYGFDTPQED